jgi:hypothetical protein
VKGRSFSKEGGISMNRRWAALAGMAVVLVCVAVGGTVGVIRAFADDGGSGAPPMVRTAPQAAKVKQTPGMKAKATWVHTGVGTTITTIYQPVDSQITIVCKKPSCLLVVDKMLIVNNGGSTTQLAPCVTHDISTGGSSCSWLGSSAGWPAGVQFGGTTTESIDLTEGTHTVNVGVYASAVGVTVGA